MRVSRVIAVELKLDYRRIGPKDPRAVNPYAPHWQGPRRLLGFRISHLRRILAGPVSYLLHPDPLDFALTDLGLYFLPNSRW
jgi:hypothetical protein